MNQNTGDGSMLRKISDQERTVPRRRFLAIQFAAALLSVALCLALQSCQTTVSTPFPQRMASAPVTLSQGDVVKLTFVGTPDLNQTQKIQTDGKINLPLIGQVTAAGRTVAELQSTLEGLYAPQLQNTTVVVTLESSVTPVVIGGAVLKPGKYLFDRPTTLLQAIYEAGGADQFGDLGRVSIIRVMNGQQRTQVVDLKPVLHGQPTQPIFVRAGDIVVIGESRF
jgi:polysaccharide export outer membrane protein